MDRVLTLLTELTEAAGVPGQEHDVREVMKQHLSDIATIEVDHLGSLIAKRAGDSAGPRVMLASHLDEVGFMVNYITDEGYIKFLPLGGWWEQVMLAQRVLIKTSKGDIVGVIGSKPPHLLSTEDRSKPVLMKEMFIDIGVADQAEAKAAGVRPGDAIVPICPLTPMQNPKYVMAKAVDNRLGCAVIVEVMRRLEAEKHPNTVYGVATVQEEVGLRGAQTATAVVEPDIGFAIDVGIAGDVPGIAQEDARSKLGKGPLLLLLDASMVPHRGLRDLVVETAEQLGIPFQYDAIPKGGTDAGKIHMYGRGVPCLVIGFPTRYIHSHAALFHRDDFDAAVELLVAVLKRLDRQTVDKLQG